MQPVATRLLSPHEEARLCWRLRGRLLANLWRQTLGHARLRLALVLVLSVVFWCTLFSLFLEAFQFLTGTLPLDTFEEVISSVFGLFFVSLMVMLLISTGIILYSNLYRSREVAFLLTTPLEPGQIFVHKFQEAVLFGSWGFLLMGTPMLVAYGMAVVAPWHYFVMLVPFLAAFVYVPSAIGAVACMLIVYFLPTARRHIVLLAGMLAVALATGVAWQLLDRSESDLLTPAWYQEMLSRLKFSQYRLLPSWWLSTGLLQASRRMQGTLSAGRPPWAEAVLFLGLIISNALFLRQFAVWIAARLFRPSYSRIHSQLPNRKQVSRAWIDYIVLRWGFFLSPAMRLLIVKDLRLFRRDPVQWTQFLIFFGLLGLYFLNVRRFGYQDQSYQNWVNLISFMNLAVVGLILSTFTTRFIFPMISLEGRRFWILGLLPVRRDTILWGKFLFAALGSSITCTSLVMLSDLMLRVSGLTMAVHLLACLTLCVGLSAIAVGLGALLPNLREESPSKIAAGFGGTLNLVVSTLYILGVVCLTAIPSHLYLAGMVSASAIAWGTAASLLLGILATVIPLRCGFRAFRAMEF